MSLPQSAADIATRLDTIDALMLTIIQSPAQYFDLNGGSVRVSKPQYMQMLRDERNFWQERLDNTPYFIMSDIEGTI